MERKEKKQSGASFKIICGNSPESFIRIEPHNSEEDCIIPIFFFFPEELKSWPFLTLPN